MEMEMELELTKETGKTKRKSNQKERGVWLATLERFGYVLTAVGETEAEAKKAVMDAYLKAYIDENGADPRQEVCEYSSGDETYWEVACEEIYVRFMPYGKVEWC